MNATQAATVDFLAVATAAIGRGFAVTPVDPNGKGGVFWGQYTHPAKNRSEVTQLSKDFPHCNVGIVSRRGVGNFCFLDIDGEGVMEQIEKETGNKMPETLVVQSQPRGKPWKRHFYFRQTPLSYTTFQKEITGIRDLSAPNGDGKYPNRYDLKGIGGGGYVVAAGSVRENGEVYTYEHDGPIAEIPDWLVNWIREDVHKYRSQAARLREAEKKKHREAIEASGRGLPLPEYTKDEINIALWNRAISYAPLGTRRETIERALREQVEDFMKDGKRLAAEWKDRIHDIAFDPNLRIGALRKEFLGKPKRPTSIKPKPVPDEPGQIVVVPTVYRYKVMATEIAGFPASLPASEVYDRLGKALKKVGLTLDPNTPADRMAVHRAMQKAGYGSRNIDGTPRWSKAFKGSARKKSRHRG
jgi:hypothetical protein